MDRAAGILTFSKLEKVVYGPGALDSVVGEAADRGAQRVYIATSKSVAPSPHLRALVDRLSDRNVGVFQGCTEHVAAAGVRGLTAELEANGADLLIAFGGGSVIDTCKAAVVSVLAGRDMTLEASELYFERREADAVGRMIPQFAVPTTLSAGEYNAATAYTSEAGEKLAIIDTRIGPCVIFNDPDLALDTPDRLWVSTGMRAFDHAVEAVYSAHSSSLTDALAVQAIRLLLVNLPKSLSPDLVERRQARGHCQTAAMLSNYAAINTMYGLSHAIGHKAGPKWMIPHGVTSCIALPHVLRFMAVAAPERFAQVAEALGVSAAPNLTLGEAAAQRVSALVAEVGAPQGFRAFGLSAADLEQIIPGIHHEICQSNAVGVPVSIDDVRAVVTAAV